MNTAALKTFAPAVRRQLMEAVTRKLDFALTAKTPDFLTTYAPQVAALRKLESADRAGLIERVAYTWFNRLAALRFMDARGWHPFRARVLTAASADETQPELLKLTRTGALPAELQSHTNPSRLNDLLDGKIPSPDAQGEVYRSLVLAACHFYHALLPDIFEKLDDETELLLPDDLLTEHSIVHGFRTEISDEDCGEVELLGWLYQFYISEKKDQVMARKSAVPTEDIPAVTQLFTPHWIVRYLVENSLGRLWLLNHPGSKLRDHMPYYIEGEENATAGSPADFLKITKPEEIRLLDPAGGSGHMLTYAFDLLVLIYEEEGYAPNDIPGLILRHNLCGLEICPRAAQLAELALVFKAREKSRRFFQPEHLVRPNIIELREVRFGDGELSAYFKALGVQPSAIHPELNRLLHQFEEAKNFGSLIKPCLTESEIQSARAALVSRHSSLATADLMVGAIHANVLRVLEQAEALTQRYHVVVANPPYMGGKTMNSQLREFAKERYADGRVDLFAMFIERGFSLVQSGGDNAMITMQAWMFLSSFEDLRAKLLSNWSISSMAHLGPRAFDTIGGEVVQTTAFVAQNKVRPNQRAIYLRLTDGRSEKDKSDKFLSALANPVGGLFFRASTADFRKIPGNLIAYWLSAKACSAFESTRLKDVADIRSGIGTSDNSRFLRMWYETPFATINFSCNSIKDSVTSKKRWFPYNKGGSHRRWFGNREYVVNWFNDGEEIKKAVTSNPNDPNTTHWSRRIFNTDLFFQPSLTWNDVGSSLFSVRQNEPGFIHDAVGVGAYGIQPESKRAAVLSLLNSNVGTLFVEVLCPTIHFKAGQMEAFPVIIPENYRDEACTECVALARADWDNFETSWDFRDQPLLRPGLKGATLAASWQNWEAQTTAAIRRMQELETQNNRLFIAAYGLQDELKPEVPEDQITLARADARKDMAAFLSYAVGCMMGRYSLDQPGLILANAGDTVKEFLAKVNRPLNKLTFTPDEDGIIPVLDGEWFEDDIVARTRDFLRATFGEATLRENLRFIEDSLGKDLRKYFLNDFYKDHLQTYKKRPIYWLVQSPKKGFSVLIYLHRYTKDTMNLVLNRYLRDYQSKLRNRLPHLVQVQATATTAREKTEARREADKLTKILTECEEWERQTMLPLAQARIELDLDDGVNTNYLKLGEALAPIAGLASKEED
jgi:type II restriction/modification system DNA methylase subunit YeeA